MLVGQVVWCSATVRRILGQPFEGGFRLYPGRTNGFDSHDRIPIAGQVDRIVWNDHFAVEMGVDQYHGATKVRY